MSKLEFRDKCLVIATKEELNSIGVNFSIDLVFGKECSIITEVREDIYMVIIKDSEDLYELPKGYLKKL